MVKFDQAQTSKKSRHVPALGVNHTSLPTGRWSPSDLRREHWWSFLTGSIASGWTKNRGCRRKCSHGSHVTLWRCPALGLRVRRRQPPTQKRPICAIFQQACRAVADMANARALHDLASLLEHVDFPVRPEALVKHHKAGLEEVAFDARVACDGVSH